MDRGALEAHVERFNRGVRSGDFEPMLAAFAPDAEMVFEGVPAGPFRGLEAIAAAYAAQPPTDEPTLKPTAHMFVGSKAPWYEILDDLPQYAESPWSGSQPLAG